MLEAIAVALGFNAEGGSKNFNFHTYESHSNLHDYLRITKSPRFYNDNFFLRAESFYNVATEVQNLGVSNSYGKILLHDQSHGEGFMSLLVNRFRGEGLYLLDEPEAALSPSRQMAMLVRMHQLVEQKSQFIIATHSPIIMAYPDADIFEIRKDKLVKVRYEETEHYTITKYFLNNTELMLKELFSS